MDFLEEEFEDYLDRSERIVYLSNSLNELFKNAISSRASVQYFNEDIVGCYKDLSIKFLENLKNKYSAKTLLIDCDRYIGNDTFDLPSEEKPIIQDILKAIQTNQRTKVSISIPEALSRVQKHIGIKRNEEVI